MLSERVSCNNSPGPLSNHLSWKDDNFSVVIEITLLFSRNCDCAPTAYSTACFRSMFEPFTLLSHSKTGIGADFEVFNLIIREFGVISVSRASAS